MQSTPLTEENVAEFVNMIHELRSAEEVRIFALKEMMITP